jgi:thermolabile hemolysin
MPDSDRPDASRPLAVGRGAFTYTYLRCWYRIDTNPLTPLARYEWARDPASGDWYRVPGYWWADGMLEWRNMFYSTTTQQTLSDVCAKTLASRGIDRPVLQALAANNQLSFNYTVWTQGSAVNNDKLERIIVFGDSLSDTQNLFNATLWQAPNSISWNAGRFSNGPLWVEYLSRSTRLPFYNWAIGGAAADKRLVLPGVVQQVDSWKEQTAQAQDYRPSNTLVLLLIGANDLINAGRTADESAASVRESLIKLMDAGASHILLLNLPDVTRAPLFRMRDDAPAIAEQVKIYNRRLTEIVEELKGRYGAMLRLELFDTHAVFDDLIRSPERYGFQNTTDACLDMHDSSAIAYLSEYVPTTACREPGRYVFWDVLHPTTQTHGLLAAKVAGFVREKFGDRLAR